MMSQRGLQLASRRLAVGQPTSSMALTKGAYAPVLSIVCKRSATIATQKATPATTTDATTILANQRLHRPVSPHISIYQPQMTWIPSILNRITGSILSGGLYIFGAAYLAAPLFGWNLSAAALAAGFAKWPVILKVLAKVGISWPFAFHSFNGIRHLVWDMGSQMTNLQVVRTGWFVIGLSTVSAVALAFL